MVDPHKSPEGETAIARRERLMNLTNPAWKPAPSSEAKLEAEEPEGAPSSSAPRAASGKEGESDAPRKG